MYYSVVIPPINPTPTQWHAPNQTCVRGAFKIKEDAIGWADKHIPGFDYKIKSYETYDETPLLTLCQH